MAGPERALRQMVARLPDMVPQDCEAILDSLTEPQRARVTALLRELRDDRPATAAVPAFDPQSVSPGLSPWLLDRLGVDGVERLPGREAMTLHAADALKACLLELDPLPYDPPRGRSLLGLLRQGVLGRLNLTPAEAI